VSETSAITVGTWFRNAATGGSATPICVKAVVLAAVLATLVARFAGSASASTQALPAANQPVPSLTPAATQKLWQQLVDHPAPQLHAFARAQACAPVRAVFYAATDWLRLSTKLAADPSPCAQYYVSVPPLTSNKSQPRSDQAWRIRALGPAFHALAEINVTGWTTWVAQTGSTWYDAGVEARRRMAAAGYDVTAGDTWALNEFSSAVRQGTGSARQNMRDFLDGLYDGDGTLPTAQGVVWVIGFGQAAADPSTYQARLQGWYGDQAWWTAIDRDTSDLMQEVFGDVRKYAVPGASPDARRDALNEYLQHPAALAAAAPPSLSAAKAVVAAKYGPLANAAWQWESGYGYTNVPFDLMEDFVSAQVYAARSAGNARFGFAWQPNNLAGMAGSEFTAETDAILGRLAAAIADSSETPAGACGVDWCNRELEGASFTTVWKSFATWIGAPPPDTTPPETTIVSGPDGPVISTSATFEFSSSEDGSNFECSLDGAPFAPCGSPASYTALAAGGHHFEVRAIDPAGNVDPTPAARDWTAVVTDEGRPHPAPPADDGPRPAIPQFTPPPGPRVPPPAR
jgi:hypothetical protein